MTLSDFLNAINSNKNDLFEDPQAEKDYVPFIVNRALSYFPDTVLYANEMNVNPNIPKRWQFEFLKDTISKRRRFAKWVKKDVPSADIAAVQQYYQCSTAKALEAISILSADQIQSIKDSLYRGGTSK
jgi:hypothetical protein